MHQFSAHQKSIVVSVVDALKPISGVQAIVLGGSYARGRARSDSDIDIGVFYSPGSAFSISELRAIASQLNDSPDPVVAGLGEWGRWVDGGAWLTIEGQRVDLLYRSIEKVTHTLEEANFGRFEIDFEQQPPFGFFGPTLLGELEIALPLHDPHSIVSSLKAKVSPMPDALAHAVVQSRLWSVEFGLAAFAPKFAAKADVYGMAGCLTRFANALVLALFALNRRYLVNDKTAIAEISEFAIVPPNFETRLVEILADIGASVEALNSRIGAMRDLFTEVRVLAGDLYTPTWRV